MSAWRRSATQRWVDAVGPAAIAAHSLRDAGWDVEDGQPFRWRSVDGTIIDVLTAAPRQVGHLIEADIERKLWLRMSSARTVHNGIDGAPWLAPLRALLAAKPSPAWGVAEKSMLRCIAANGFWPLERLRQCGYETDGLCPLCREPQTLFHLLWRCQLTAAQRQQWGLPDALRNLALANPD